MFDVAIIGGGIIGLMTALELSKADLSIVVIDKNKIGRAASLAGGGILSSLNPWDDEKSHQLLCSLSQKKYPVLAEELHSETGIDPEFIQSGLLIIEPEHSDEFNHWCTTSDTKIDYIQATDITRYAEIGTEQKRSVYLPEVAQIRNPKLIQALEKKLLDSGIKIIENNAIENIRYKKNKIESLECQHEAIKAGHFVLAAGAWSGEEIFQADISIKPIRGQMLCYQPGIKLLDKIILSEGHYIIPRKDNILLIGSTLEDVGFDLSTTEEARMKLHHFASELLPELSGHKPIKHWSGLRPRTDHGLPYIGQHPAIENMLLNTGHYRNGLLSSLASAEIIADILLQRQTAIDTSDFRAL